MRFTLHGALHGDVLIGMDLLSPTPKLHNYYTQRLPSRFNPLTILDLQSGSIIQNPVGFRDDELGLSPRITVLPSPQ